MSSLGGGRFSNGKMSFRGLRVQRGYMHFKDALHKTDLMPEHRDFFLSLLSIYKVLGIGGLFLCRPLVCSFVYRTPWTTQVLGDPTI